MEGRGGKQPKYAATTHWEDRIRTHPRNGESYKRMTREFREPEALTSRFDTASETGAVHTPKPRRERTRRALDAVDGAPSPLRAQTPAAIRPFSGLAVRRVLFGALVALTVAALAAALAGILATDGFSFLDALLVGALVVEAIWSVHNAWNAIIGFVLIRILRRPTETVFPPAARAHDDDQVFTRTAILMTLRNEDCDAAFSRMKAIKQSVDATGHGAHFDYFILSDSTTPEAIEAEETAVARWRAQSAHPEQIRYRRRKENVGYKAGNVFDFCERFGADYDYMIPLDADSIMTGETILRMVRIAQANPKIGLLQSLISGTPSRSFFERLLHFGPRHNARMFIFGSSWWQGDSGPFWGHNALIRVAPFTQHCRLPILKGERPLGGHILSHDQVEAVLMRRGGYEVRVLPEELGSYEDNPPTVLDFLRRHLRWCLGNLQYLKLRHEPGMLQPKATHFYLWLALELFFSMAGMVAFVVLAAIAAALWPADVPFPTTSAGLLLAAWLTVYHLPKIIGTLDALLFDAQRFGGRLRLLAGSAIDTVAGFILTPVANVVCVIFMLGLAFGRDGKVTWNGQRRGCYGISWREATAALWPVTAVGVLLLAFLAATAPGAIPWFLLFAGGLLAAIPFTVVTSWPWLGELAARRKFLALPEEFDTPRELSAVLPWLDRQEPARPAGARVYARPVIVPARPQQRRAQQRA